VSCCFVQVDRGDKLVSDLCQGTVQGCRAAGYSRAAMLPCCVAMQGVGLQLSDRDETAAWIRIMSQPHTCLQSPLRLLPSWLLHIWYAAVCLSLLLLLLLLVVMLQALHDCEGRAGRRWDLVARQTLGVLRLCCEL